MSRLAPEMEKRAKDLIGVYPKSRSALIPLLHLAQEQNGYLSEASMEHIAELVGITAAEVLSVASFYDMFHLEPVGTYLLGVCTNIACMLNGGEELLHHLEHKLGVRNGETTADGMFTIEEMECVAHCDKAPCMQVNYRYFGPLPDEAADKLLEDLASGRMKDTVPPHGTLMRVRRDGGLRATQGELAAERAAMQIKVDERAAVAKTIEDAAKTAQEAKAATDEKRDA